MAHVGRDVLTDAPVAPGGQAAQPPTLVHDVDGEPVDLQLAQQRRDLPELALDAPRPRVDLLEAEGVVEAEQSLQVLHRLEHLRAGAAHGLGGRVGAGQLRVPGLEVDELAVQRVVLDVGQGRRVLLVVAVPRRLDLVDELVPPGPRGRVDRRGRLQGGGEVPVVCAGGPGRGRAGVARHVRDASASPGHLPDAPAAHADDVAPQAGAAARVSCRPPRRGGPGPPRRRVAGRPQPGPARLSRGRTAARPSRHRPAAGAGSPGARPGRSRPGRCR